MFKDVTILFIAILSISNSNAYDSNCGKAVPESYSGVYYGWLDTFGICEYDTAKATVYINYNTSPFTIVYDGAVLEHYSYVGEEVYYTGYTGNYKQVLFGVFESKGGQPGFTYTRILNHFYDDEPKNYKPFFWTKTAELDLNNAEYKGYIDDHNKFKEFFKAFETAFFAEDAGKLKDYCSFPVMDNTQNPAVKITQQDLAAFMKNVFAITKQIRKGEGKYNAEQYYPVRFGDHDPCFAKSYTWSYPTPRMNFTKVNGEYKLTGCYEYE